MHREWRFFLVKELQIEYREKMVVAIVAIVAIVVAVAAVVTG